MASKSEIIKAIGEAADRVLKAAADPSAIAASLKAAQDELQEAITSLAAGVVDYEILYDAMGGCRAVLMSIYDGYPMVPADAQTVAAKAEFFLKAAGEGTKKDMNAEEFVEHAISELEFAKTEKRDTKVKRIMAIKAALLMWEDLPEGQQPLPVVMIEHQLVGAGAQVIDPKTAQLAAGTVAFSKGIERLANIAKAAAPVVPPVRGERWDNDLAGRRNMRGKR